MKKEKVLEFHPAVHGFQFANNWRWTDQQKKYAYEVMLKEAPKIYGVLSGLGVAASIFSPIIGSLLIPGLISFAIWKAKGYDKKLAKEIVNSISKKGTLGLCGGMAHASADYFMANMLMPGINHTPADSGTNHSREELSLRNYIFDRLIDTFRTDVVDYIKWHTKVNDQDNLAGYPEMPFGDDLEDEVDEIIRRIDSGQPVTLGIFYKCKSVGDQHQVLCYGYKDRAYGSTNTKRVTILYIYDSNKPGKALQYKVTIDSKKGTSLITTDYPTGTKWLGYLIAVGYTPSTPPQCFLTAKSISTRNLEGWKKDRIGCVSEIDVELEYKGAGQSLAFDTTMQLVEGPTGASTPGKSVSGSVPGIADGTVKVQKWRHVPTGADGKRRLKLIARRTLDSNVSGGAPFVWEYVIPVAVGNQDIWDFQVYPSVIKRTESLVAAGPVAVKGRGLLYNFELKGDQNNGLNQWLIEYTRNVRLKIASSGQNVAGSGMVTPGEPKPSKAKFKYMSETHDGSKALCQIFKVDFPRGEVVVKVRPDQTKKWGLPRKYFPATANAVSNTAVWAQGYSGVFVDLAWNHLTEDTVTIQWVTSLSNRVFEKKVVGVNSVSIPIDMIPEEIVANGVINRSGSVISDDNMIVGADLYPTVVQDGLNNDKPDDAVVKFTITDSGGQILYKSIFVQYHFPVASIHRESEMEVSPSEPGVMREKVLTVLRSVREELSAVEADGNFAAELANVDEEEVMDLFEEQVEAGTYEEVLSKCLPEALEHENWESVSSDEYVLLRLIEPENNKPADVELYTGDVEMYVDSVASESGEDVQVVGEISTIQIY